MKKLGILTHFFTTVLIMTSCGNNEAYEPQPSTETDPPMLEADEPTIVEESEQETPTIPEVAEEDLEGIPDDALVIPLADLHEHELSNVFENDEWMICHLTGECTQSVWAQTSVNGDLLIFGIPDRIAIASDYNYIYSCATNERNNLLICEILAQNFGGGGETFGIMDTSIQLPEMTVRITDATTFEIWHTDGHHTDESEGTRRDLVELLESGSTAFSLNVAHEEINGEIVATHILMMIFPW